MDIFHSPNETTLMLSLLREGAIAVGEVYYTPVEFTNDVRDKSQEYLHYLSKRDSDYNLCTIAHLFSKYEPDFQLTDRLALYFPDIKAYVRCGDFEPRKIFDLLQRDCCERVIIVAGAQPDEDSPDEAFYSFEMRAPKSYILERLKQLSETRLEEMRRMMDKMGKKEDAIFPDVPTLPNEE